MTTTDQILDMAVLLKGYACDLRALELIPSLGPSDVDEVGDTMQDSFYTYQNLGIANQHANDAQYDGIDLGHEFDFVPGLYSELAVYDASPYAAVLQQLAVAAVVADATATTIDSDTRNAWAVQPMRPYIADDMPDRDEMDHDD